jgi:8-oxo-dGTP pyrophosphatase MutT (NUDIX family)
MKKSKEQQLNISLERAKHNKLFYFVVTGIIYHPKKKKCLILQRSKTEKAHAGLWGVTGGKMEWSDMTDNPITRKNHEVLDWEGLVEKLLIREAKEESGLTVGEPHYLDSVVYLRPDNVPVVCIKFAVKFKEGRVKIPPEFDDFAWVDGAEVKKFSCIDGIAKEVAATIKIFSSLP